MAKSVLLIEDEPHIVEALSFLLTKEGWDVDVHNDGDGALERVSALKPNLIVLDFMLPNKSGIEILYDIRSETDIKDTPILMLTAKGQNQDRRAAEDAGVSMFMTKPFSNHEIIENVRSLIA